MAVTTETLVGSVLTILNNSSNVASPYSNYNGSFFFGPNQEITLVRQLPKGRVRTGESSFSGTTKSMGVPFKRDKVYNLYIDFYTNDSVTDSTGKKQVELMNRYLELIETALVENRIPDVVVGDFITDVPPQRAPELGNGIWVATLSTSFTTRK